MENSSSSKSNKGVMIAIVVVLVLIGGYFLMNKKAKSDKMVPPTQTDTNTATTPMADENAQAVPVSGTEFSFSPSTLTFKVGQPVTVTFTNTGKMPHDFVIDEITGAKTPMVKPGESATITFTPSTAGVFKFYCGVGNHRAQGMEGTVTVN